MASARIVTSISPALALLLGFVLIILGTVWEASNFVQSGWSFVTIGMLVEVALPIARRLR